MNAICKTDEIYRGELMVFNDLKAQYLSIKNDVDRRMQGVLDHGQFILGPEVEMLENRLAEYVRSRHCISCSSGTDAILMSLMAYEIGPGDAVFTTPFSFVSAAEMISLLGATPVFVDIDKSTFNIDPHKLARAVEDVKTGVIMSPRDKKYLTPRGVIAVDLFGLPADYKIIKKIAHDNSLFVIEDGAQSFGASYRGKRACSLADIGTTSFFPAKPLGCYGDGGAIFTDDREMAERLRSIRTHGKGENKYENVRLGINGRLDTIQAAVLLSKLEVFDKELMLRQQIAQIYTETFKDVFKTPQVPRGYTSSWALYSVMSSNRDLLRSICDELGIPASVYYPKPLNLQKALSHSGAAGGAMPVSEKCCRNVLSLPLHPYMSEDEIERVLSLKECYLKRVGPFELHAHRVGCI
ncbi:DegT/DnrJ/EryC1/StrS family protein [Chitinispirillum alkaliphilum]|nr:DegT/DnrJ/EryC1/StrS family protein [Chitinispirillum alkaliphilum]